jgi:hypothetical protein
MIITPQSREVDVQSISKLWKGIHKQKIGVNLNKKYCKKLQISKTTVNDTQL